MNETITSSNFLNQARRFKKADKQVVILIDEYDKPLPQTFKIKTKGAGKY